MAKPYFDMQSHIFTSKTKYNKTGDQTGRQLA